MDLKRGKFNHPTWTTEKIGANEEGENEGETHAATAIPTWPSFPPIRQCHYSANNNHSPYPPPNMAYTPNENVNNSTLIPIESQQPQTDHAHVS